MDAPYLMPGGVSVIDGNIVQEKYGGDANAIVRSMPGTFLSRVSHRASRVLRLIFVALNPMVASIP